MGRIEDIKDKLIKTYMEKATELVGELNIDQEEKEDLFQDIMELVLIYLNRADEVTLEYYSYSPFNIFIYYYIEEKIKERLEKLKNKEEVLSLSTIEVIDKEDTDIDSDYLPDEIGRFLLETLDNCKANTTRFIKCFGIDKEIKDVPTLCEEEHVKISGVYSSIDKTLAYLYLYAFDKYHLAPSKRIKTLLKTNSAAIMHTKKEMEIYKEYKKATFKDFPPYYGCSISKDSYQYRIK